MTQYVSVAILLFCFVRCLAAEEDPRETLGTRSLEAARAFQKGQVLSEQKQFKAAYVAFKQSADFDKTFQLARYWMALSAGDIGDIESALENYKAVIQIGKEDKVTNVTVDAAVNLALTYANLDKETEASYSFTEAILLDPTDQHKLHWKAYRNMSIGLDAQKKHLSAAMCAVLAYQANPERVGDQMLMDFLTRVGAEEVGQILHFANDTPQVGNRADPTQIKGLGLTEGLTEPVSDLQVDVPGNRVVALVKDAAYYYLLDVKRPKSAVRVNVNRPVKACSLVAGELYLSIENPSAIARVEIATGKVLAEWKLNNAAPTSLAALPAQGIACFPLGGKVDVLNFDDGSLTDNDFLCTRMSSDPRQRFCYSYIHPGFKDTGGHVIINGRPVFFRAGGTDWAQTALFQYAVNSYQMIPAAFRLNAAANGQQMHISADGNWIGVAGGGGWRPEVPTGDSGYGVAIFQAQDLSRMVGFFPTDAYPVGVSVNHISRHVAVWRAGDGRVYHMNNRKDFSKLTGSFGAASTWSADGRYLFIADKEKGVNVFELQLNAEESAAATAFPANIAKSYPRKIIAKSATVANLAELRDFQVRGDAGSIQTLLQRIPKEGRTNKPIAWSEHRPFFKSEAQKAEFLKYLEQSRTANAGIAIFQLKEYLKKDPDHPVANHLLGMSYYSTQQLPEAQAAQIKAIRVDQGKTNVTVEALRMLAYLNFKEKRHNDAAYCYTYVHMLDSGNPKWIGESRAFYERANLLAAAKPVLEPPIALTAAGGNGGNSELPVLEVANGLKPMRANEIYKKAINSVVLINAGEASGSGVCVGSNRYILTNHHVIEKSPQNIQVVPFVLIGDSPKRMTAVIAKVIASDPQQDIAVLQLSDAPESLEPLPIAPDNPSVGASVYAIGSPGLGKKILEQSMSNGIVSSAARQLDGAVFIQHTAAVNPGNSGGPLFDESGQVVGINTIKAKLEGVSFAIPASRIRIFFLKK